MSTEQMVLFSPAHQQSKNYILRVNRLSISAVAHYCTNKTKVVNCKIDYNDIRISFSGLYMSKMARMVIHMPKSTCPCKSHGCLNRSVMTRKYHENKSFYFIHHVTKVIVCTLAVNQNTLKTTAKEKFTNNSIYSNGLSLC